RERRAADRRRHRHVHLPRRADPRADGPLHGAADLIATLPLRRTHRPTGSPPDSPPTAADGHSGTAEWPVRRPPGKDDAMLAPKRQADDRADGMPAGAGEHA